VALGIGAIREKAQRGLVQPRRDAGYDMAHLVTYLRLLDADADGADWREVAAIVLELDMAKDPKRAKRSWESHLARGKWMTESGYRYLLRGGPPN
jgi:hypothetical protein